MSNPPKQPYQGLFKGPYAMKEPEGWYWKDTFLRAALGAIPKSLPWGKGRTLARLLIDEIMPAWCEADRKYRRPIERGDVDECPAHVSWYLALVYGKKFEVSRTRFNEAWFRRRRAWPAIHEAVKKTGELLRACNLDGYLDESGATRRVEWVRELILETAEMWLQPEWVHRFMYKPRPDGSIPRFALYLPDQQSAEIHAWQDGGRKSPLGWEPHISTTVDERGNRVTGQGFRRREKTFSLTAPVYDPLEGPPAPWRATALQQFKVLLAGHIERMIAVAQEGEKFVKGTRKRELEHFEWLARYQVGGESYTKISHSCQAELHTVQEAIRRTADLISLPLRKQSKSGRPKKSTGHVS